MGQKLTLIIPVSGNLSDLCNLKTTILRSQAFLNQVSILIIFDSKSSVSSTNNWAEISSWKFPNVGFHEGRFSSVGAARNFGLSKVLTDWVAFCDSDDVNLMDEFLLMTKDAELAGSDIAVGKFFRVDNKTGQIQDSNQEVLSPKNFQYALGRTPGIWRCAFRFETIYDLRFPNLSMAEDQIFMARVFNQKREIHLSQRVVYQYFVGSGESLTSTLLEVEKILEAIPLALDLARNTKGPYLRILESFAISQVLSGIKYSKVRIRFTLLAKLTEHVFFESIAKIPLRLGVLIKIANR